MTNAIESIQSAITALITARDLEVAKVHNAFGNRIAKHEQAIELLGGKPSKARPKRSRVKATTEKPKRTRAPRVDPNLGDDKQSILDSLTRGNGEPSDPVGSDAIVNSTELSKSRVALLLRQLVEAGAVVRDGKARATTYRLAEAKAEEAAE